MTDTAPTRVVIDCDTGVDDAMAILYGLLSPNIEIVGLTCCWGNIWVETTTANTLRLLEIVQMPSIPVAMGARKPLLGPIWELGNGVHGADGQGNTNLPPPKLEPVKESAAELLVRLAHEHPGELTLVPIAPLTNVAAALALDPSIAQLYKEVVLMGGNFLAPGNAAKWAEANIWHDPEAAQMVFEAGWPITAVGLCRSNIWRSWPSVARRPPATSRSSVSTTSSATLLDMVGASARCTMPWPSRSRPTAAWPPTPPWCGWTSS